MTSSKPSPCRSAGEASTDEDTLTQGDGKMEDDCDYLEGCYLCGGKRYIVTCIDDLCRNSDECMHGDGEEDCPACNKTGELEWEIF